MNKLWSTLNDDIIWKDIPGYENLYQISNKGQVRSLDRIVNGRKYKGKILKNQKDRYGYEQVKIYHKGSHKCIYIHRFLALLFIDNKHNKDCVNHKDGNKLNNAIENLEWCTKKENNHHAFNTGLNNVNGENNVTHKYSDKTILKIRELFKTKKYTQKEIAKITNVKYTTVNAIVNNRRRVKVGK